MRGICMCCVGYTYVRMHIHLNGTTKECVEGIAIFNSANLTEKNKFQRFY